MSKLLRKILKAAVFPAALMIVSKLAGLALANKVFDLGWELETNVGSLFSVRVSYADTGSVIISNSYSNLAMYIGMLLGSSIILFQAYFLHSSHQDPRVLVKLMDINFLVWLTDSENLFPRLAVWLAFLWGTTLILITQTIQGMTYPWVSISALIVTVIATWLGIKDFERDLHTIIPENGKLKS